MAERIPFRQDPAPIPLDSSALASLIPAILRSVDAVLETSLSREIQSADGKTLLDIIRGLLFWSIQRIERGDALYDARSDALNVFLKSSQKSAGELEAVIASEADFYAGLDPESVIDAATAYLGGKSTGRPSFAASEPQLDQETITAYLRQRYPQFDTLSVDGVTILTGGLSKDTILFDLKGAGELDGGIVLRKDFVHRGSDFSALDEYPLLEAVYRAGLPVAEPLWPEADTAHFGAAFIAVRRVTGSAAVGEGFSDPAIKRHFVDRLAKTLAQVHALSPVDLNIYSEKATLPVTILLQQQVEQWSDFWQRSQLEPDPAMDSLFTWMATHIPPEPNYGPTVVHGDYGFHNLLTKDGEVTAILDWEFSHIGDPAEDVAYVRQFVEPLGMWQEFLADYARYGGRAFDDGRSEYFTIWQNVRNACLCAGALNAFSRGRPGHLRMGSAGISLFPRFKLAALRQIAGVAAREETDPHKEA